MSLAATLDTSAAVALPGVPGVDLGLMRDPGRLASAGWDDLPGASPFLHSEWLSALAIAGAPPTRYAQFRQRRSGTLIGVALVQQLPVRNMTLGKAPSTWVARVLGRELSQFGQVLFSGRHGLHFAAGQPATQLVAGARRLLASGRAPGTWLAKDLAADCAAPSSWTPIRALPDLALELPSSWNTFEDYASALPGKYRRRLRRARRLFAAGLTTRPLSGAEADRFGESLDRLYAALLARAAYVPYRTAPGYVARLKRAATERCVLRGYFDGERLVGFSTLLLGGGQALAHFAAVEPSYNPTHQLYLNLLFDLVAEAIARGATCLHLGRTATTIKSSLGAVPREYTSIATHGGPLRRRLLSLLNAGVLARADAEADVRRPLG